VLAFDLAEKYRAITVVLTDGNLGQMMEPAELPPMQPVRRAQPEWAITGAIGRERRILSSIYLNVELEEGVNIRLLERWNQIEANEIRYKEYFLDDAEFVVIGFGTAGRVALSAVRSARAEGIRVGLLRPITVNPYPVAVVKELAERASAMLVVEMNSGQMLDDVIRAVNGKIPVEFYGRMGGVVPFPDEIHSEIKRLVQEPLSIVDDPRKSWMKRLAMVRG